MYSGNIHFIYAICCMLLTKKCAVDSKLRILKILGSSKYIYSWPPRSVTTVLTARAFRKTRSLGK